ncbi:uncharacterized protein LOC111712605 isoform X2 [Eurytemora carolleeae]|nr:uncharacterized protein LOC111712605 isoform X2 [Eurytemora carolleeae]|eukprot:XP_023343045.1 uncharacterized protein LOC111712605 isoform X2 [Eurytemora affinis]
MLLLLLLFVCTAVAGEQVQCNKQHYSSALTSSANCQPRLKVIRLEPPGNLTIETMTPLYISVLRCGGACPTSTQSCVPTKQRKKDVPVIIGSCGVESGVCDKECYTLSVDEDTECQCSCLEKQKKCGPGKVFNSGTCSCRCEDSLADTVCREAGRVWQTDSCTCGCPLHTIVPCTTGLKFDNETCTCLDQAYRKPEEKISSESRVARSNLIIKMESVEGMIIGVLSGAVLVFLLIIIILAGKVISLKRRLKRLKRNGPAGDPSYLVCSTLAPGPSYPSPSPTYPSPGSTYTQYPNPDSSYPTLETGKRPYSPASPRIEYERVGLLNSVETTDNCGSIIAIRNTDSPNLVFLNPKLKSDPYARLLECEGTEKSDSIDSSGSGSRGESGFESGRGGSSGSGTGYDPMEPLDSRNIRETRGNSGNDSLSVLSSALSTRSTSNPSIFSVGSRSRETPV